MRGEPDIENRRRGILAAIVRHYVATGIPVGSKTISAQLAHPLSSATIRHVMAELEAEGFLEQPHTSAGRVPTDKAYRHYVDCLMKWARLGPETEEYIENALPKSGSTLEAIMATASRILSEVSHSVGLVLGPAIDEQVLEQIKFMSLPERRLLAVVVLKPEGTESKVIRLEQEGSQEDLDRAANYLNAEFRGWTLRTIRLELANRIEGAQAAFGRILRNVAMLLRSGALGRDEPGPLFVDGAAKVLDRPEFDDIREVKKFVAALEEKTALVESLSAFLRLADSGVQVSIGGENPSSEMRHCALVVAPLQWDSRPVGALGVVGPTRMEYDRALPAVDFIAQLCGRLLVAN